MKKIISQQSLILLTVIIFICFSLYGINQYSFYTLLLPFALFLVAGVLLKPRLLFFSLPLLTPFSFNIEEIDKSIGLYLPTEIILILLTFLIILFTAYNKNYFSTSFLKHPISKIIIAHICWLFVCTILSTNPIVSLKFLISRSWFILPMYFLGGKYLMERTKRLELFNWLYIVGFIGVILYTLIRHSSDNFSLKWSHFAMAPFFKDHTSYGSMLAFFIPFLWLIPRITKTKYKALIAIPFIIFHIGLIFSYTRAAWLSLVGALGVYVLIQIKPKKSTIIIGLVALMIGGLSLKGTIEKKFSKNTQQSSGKLSEHLNSVSNVSSDASNLERINRWKCAIKMFKARPVFGFGPGNYAKEYGVFQDGRDKTIISTNFGEGGNAHSEYLGTLAETGLFGGIILVLLIFYVYKTAIENHYKLEDKKLKALNLSALLGLTTYLLHSFLNNYLDTDKASIPFWFFIAFIAVVNIQIKKSEEQNRVSETRKS